MAKAYARDAKLLYVETSAKTGAFVQSAFETLCECILQREAEAQLAAEAAHALLAGGGPLAGNAQPFPDDVLRLDAAMNGGGQADAKPPRRCCA